MKAFKYIVATVLALVGLVAGGGGVVLSATGYMSLRNSQSDFGLTEFSIFAGVIPGIGCLLLAWVAFRSARRTP